MIRVRIFTSFGTEKGAIDVYSRVLSIINILEYGTSIVFVDDDSYTHAVLLNTAMPSLTCPKENVLGLAFEPNAFLNLTYDFLFYANKYIGKYYVGSKESYLKDPFIEHHGFMWHCPFPKTIQPKNKTMSIIFSHKQFAPGHKYRSLLVSAILMKGLAIDIYGNGCELLKTNGNDSRIKGKFTDSEPYDGYMYSIAIENYSLPGYYSEKYLNCLMYETTPIYLGCPNVENDYPDHTIFLSGKLKEDLEMIKSILESPEKYRKQIDRYNVIEKHNLIKHLLDLWYKK